jgi:hypothetical protein
MKKTFLFILACLILGAAGENAEAAYHSFEYAAGLSPTESVDKTQLEGWIVKVDYNKSSFRMLDPRGFERTVRTKSGTIGDYRRGDHVKVTIDRDYQRASFIEKK